MSKGIKFLVATILVTSFGLIGCTNNEKVKDTTGEVGVSQEEKKGQAMTLKDLFKGENENYILDKDAEKYLYINRDGILCLFNESENISYALREPDSKEYHFYDGTIQGEDIIYTQVVKLKALITPAEDDENFDEYIGFENPVRGYRRGIFYSKLNGNVLTDGTSFVSKTLNVPQVYDIDNDKLVVSYVGTQDETMNKLVVYDTKHGNGIELLKYNTAKGELIVIEDVAIEENNVAITVRTGIGGFDTYIIDITNVKTSEDVTDENSIKLEGMSKVCLKDKKAYGIQNNDLIEYDIEKKKSITLVTASEGIKSDKGNVSFNKATEMERDIENDRLIFNRYQKNSEDNTTDLAIYNLKDKSIKIIENKRFATVDGNEIIIRGENGDYEIVNLEK
ncbi:MAG: hypothetical protein ACRC41_01550 [Sarcina sp.]